MFAFTGVCVPQNIGGDAEFAGAILEAMQSESYYTLVPAYFDVALDSKFFRDEESREMLGIILSNRAYPLDILKDFGGLMASLKNNISKGKTDFVSVIDSSDTKAKIEITKLIEKIEALG